jgi:hypothetical protein
MDELVEFVPGGWPVAIVIGVGLFVFRRGFRPVAKGAVKVYLTAAEGVKEATEGAREGMQDLYAEARSEAEQAKAESPSKARGPRQKATHEPAIS